ncbi:MAG: NAD-dependent epimerase/dehydratase family protein [Chlorobiaceae bacterium]|nr:NAD-dependent epimerase/dehydratase family protein [Chlorobiaceae bacterium]NTW11258.1 NAD-dependent epimerase/dehydratase family protein [Chlorobiaceae bacterium]
MTTVLVTGASGFIGSHLVSRCLLEKFRVKVLVRKGNPVIDNFEKQGIEVIEGDIRDYEAVKKAVNECNIVFHAAALTSDWGSVKDFTDINIGGTRNICEAVLNCGTERLVYISSFETYNHSELDRIDERTPYSVRNHSYADTKIAGTETVKQYIAKGVTASIVYPVWVYGPGDRTLFPNMAEILRNNLFFYWRQHARMSMIYIDNLVDLLMLAAKLPQASGEDFLACDGVDMTFEEFCERLAKGVNAPIPFIYLPYELVYLLAGALETVYGVMNLPKRPMLTRQAVNLLASRALVDSSKARKVLGWAPAIPQEEGFRRTLEWLNTLDPSEWKMK